MDKVPIQRNLHKKIKEIFFSEITSTQTYCRDNFASLLSKERMWHVVIAERQTKGIGQEDRKWESNRNNVYCTFIVPMKSNFLMFMSFIPLITVCSIANIFKNYGVDQKVKWINDIMVNNKKISGILCESYTIGDESVVLIGIGINTNLTQEQIDMDPIDQEITSLSIEIEKIKILEKIKNEDSLHSNNNKTNTIIIRDKHEKNENTNIENDINLDRSDKKLFRSYNISTINNHRILNLNKNKENNLVEPLINSGEIYESKNNLENGIYLKTVGKDEDIKIEIDNRILIENLKNELFENLNKILCLETPASEINYDFIKLNFTVFTLNPLRSNLAFLNKNVVVLNTQFNNRKIVGKFLGLDENGFAKIKEKNTKEIFAVTKGRMQSIRNLLLNEKWNDNVNFKSLHISKIKFNKQNNTIKTISNISHDEIYYCIEGKIIDRLGNQLIVFGDLIEKKEILNEDEKEIFKINLFFDINKSEIISDFNGYIDKDNHLEEFNLKRFYSDVYLKGVFNPDKEIICFTYACDKKDFNFIDFINDYNNKNTKQNDGLLLKFSCTEIYEKMI